MLRCGGFLRDLRLSLLPDLMELCRSSKAIVWVQQRATPENEPVELLDWRYEAWRLGRLRLR